MPERTKSPIIVFIILIVFSLSFAGMGFYLLQKEKIKSFSLQEELDSLRIKQNAAETKLQEYTKTISQLELRLGQAQANVDSLNISLEQERREKQDALDEALQLRSEIDQQKSLRADLEAKLQQKQKEAERIQAQLKDIGSRKAQLETRIKDLEAKTKTAPGQAQGVELGTIVVAPEASSVSEEGAGTAYLEGKVLVVNKDYNFVVINLGSKDGVNAQDIFALYHNNKYIGDIKVEKVHESMSAADFVSPSVKDVVSEGDRVVRKTK